MLKIPFIGAYVIRPYTTLPPASGPTLQFVEMNSITMDASQATASPARATELTPIPAALQTATAADEAVGRFCPLAAMNPSQTLYTTGTNNDPYGWAAHFFDYLDVQVAGDDFFPNVDPRLADGSTVTTANTPKATNPLKYTLATSVTTNVPDSVANGATGVANGTPDQAFGKQGLININTAPSYVLQQLPGVTPTIADQIVSDRTTNGPFKTIFDLNRVGTAGSANSFQTEGGLFTLTGTLDLKNDPGFAGGDFTVGPDRTDPTVKDDGVRGDFEERMLMLTRISNLITTRSDTFTCYVLLQGWRNVGTSNPTLAVQRRAVFILDRNSVTPSNNSPSSFRVPAQ
jgi:DNA uptake protein ComE-like DNA-binding protein